MKDRSITKLAVENLELLFTPHGLPVIDKGADAPTTSIAVLGDAGAGKTTLATALAHAIAREVDGCVLFLSTELAPTEIKYKVALLGLDARVYAWNHRHQARVGDIIGQHVALMDLPDERRPVRTRALEAAWQLLETHGVDPHVRCVVIDAFPLPDANSASTRDEIVTLVQALESRGISVVIIQEATGTTDYVPFITDLVFELKFSEDPDTGERLRKLACPKSRYVRALVGPHDTGVIDGHVATWPNPLVVEDDRRIDSPAVLLPAPGGDSVVLLRGGCIVVADFREQQLIELIPGMTPLFVSGGPVISLHTDPRVETMARDGAAALTWAVWNTALRDQATLIVMRQLESLLSRGRFRNPLEDGLVALRRRGFVLVLRDPVFAPIADFVANEKFASSTAPKRAHRTAGLWLAAEHWPREYGLEDREMFLASARRGGTAIVFPRPDGRSSLRQILIDALTDRFADAVRGVYALPLPLPDALGPLWNALNAALAGNRLALASVLATVDDIPALLDLALRALALQDRWSELDDTVERVAKRWHIEPWLAARLKADARIDGGDNKTAIEMLSELVATTNLPTVHRAFALHNRGVALAKLGHHEAARSEWRGALSLNPEIEIAQQCLNGDVVP